MDEANAQLASGLISKSYIAQGMQSLGQRSKAVKALLSSRRLPEQGWDEATIEMFIQVRYADMSVHGQECSHGLTADAQQSASLLRRSTNHDRHVARPISRLAKSKAPPSFSRHICTDPITMPP